MACDCIYKLVLILVNIVFLLLGLALTIGGAILIWGYAIINTLVSGIVSGLKTYMESTGSNFNAEDLITGIMSMLKYVGIPLFILGLFLVAISLCGMCGACYKLRILLIVYIVVMIVLVLIQVIVAILYFAGGASLDNWVKDRLRPTLDGFTDNQLSNIQTVAWFVVHTYIECCGVDNATNFDSITTWNRTILYKMSSGISNYYHVVYPYSCCKLNPDSFKLKDESCLVLGHNVNNSNVNIGCYSGLRDKASKYLSPVLIGIISVAGGQIFLILCAIGLCCSGGKISPL